MYGATTATATTATSRKRDLPKCRQLLVCEPIAFALQQQLHAGARRHCERFAHEGLALLQSRVLQRAQRNRLPTKPTV